MQKKNCAEKKKKLCSQTMNVKGKKVREKLTPRFWSKETYRNHHLSTAKKFVELHYLNEDENEEEQEKFLESWEERSTQSSAEKLLKR